MQSKMSYIVIVLKLSWCCVRPTSISEAGSCVLVGPVGLQFCFWPTFCGPAVFDLWVADCLSADWH